MNGKRPFPHELPRKPKLPLEVELGPFATSTTWLVAPKSALDIPRVRKVSELLVAELKRSAQKD
jgi:hypothetical protein